MDIKLVLAIIAIGLASLGYIPYILDIKSGKTKPHAFSWFIWSLDSYIAGFTQLSSGGGIGSFITITAATLSLWIAYMGYRKSGIKYTRSDWISLYIALFAIPLWILTKQPLLAVLIISFIDVVAFWPTIRKSLKRPDQETIGTYILSTIKHTLTVVAQQNYNLVTVFYPATLAIFTALLVAMLAKGKIKVITSKHRS